MAEKQKPKNSFEQELYEALPGVVAGKGWWRLSVVVGGLFLSVWVAMVALMISQSGWSLNWVRVAITTLLVFFIPWAVIQAIGWVVEGFKQQRNS